MSDINSNLLTKTGYTAGQLQAAEAAIRGDNAYHSDFWQALVDAENTYNLSSLFILAHADVESAHGTSGYAENRDNLFGFNAVDSDPDLASSYASDRDSVLKYADFLSHYYLYEGQPYWGGAASAHGIFVHYSSSHDAEAETVVGLMNTLQSHISGLPAPTPTPTSPAAPSGNSYQAVHGDNMSTIAEKEGETLLQLEHNNPNAGHPAGNYGVIWPGDTFIIGGPAPAPSAPSATYHTVAGGENLSVIAENNGESLGTIETLNPNAGHPAGNFGDIWPGDQIRIR